MKIQKYLTYKFSKFGQTNRWGSWSEDKFFKLLLFRNLYRQQGNNRNKMLMVDWISSGAVDIGLKHRMKQMQTPLIVE